MSVRKAEFMIHVYGSTVKRDKEKCALHALTGVCIKQVNFSKKNFSLGQTKLSVIYVIYYVGVCRAGIQCT